MTDVFSLPSLFFGIYLSIPMLLGCYLLFGFNSSYESLMKAQRLAGILMLLNAVYLIVRTALVANLGFNHPVLKYYLFIIDSVMLTVFALIPYTVIRERYPKWWMFVLTLTPLLLIPVVVFTNEDWVAVWSHLFPIIVAVIVLYLSYIYAREADKKLFEYYADPELHEKSWIIWVSAGFIVVTVASFLRYLFPGFTWYNLFANCMWCALQISVFWMLTRQKPLRGGVGAPLERKPRTITTLL